MAALAAVEVRGSRKLSRMFVHVAVGAALEPDLEERVFTLGDVAPGTLHPGVSALQGLAQGIRNGATM